MISFEQISKVFAFNTNKKYCIEIEFSIMNNQKYDECWMGKTYDNNIEKDIYWFGLMSDGMNALSINGCEPQEHLNYVMEKHITSKNGGDLSDFIE